MAALISMLRWTARVWSVSVLLLVLAILVGEGVRRVLRLAPRKLPGLAFFPTGGRRRVGRGFSKRAGWRMDEYCEFYRILCVAFCHVGRSAARPLLHNSLCIGRDVPG